MSLNDLDEEMVVNDASTIVTWDDIRIGTGTETRNAT